MRELTDEELAVLQAQASEPPPEKGPPPPDTWMPSLLPGQLEVFNDKTDSTLVEGPRFSGKGWACGYRAVRHCWDHYNALLLVVVKTKRQGTSGGFFSKLGNEILPDYKANLEGFDYVGPAVTQEKDIIYKVKNRFGGWSIIQMISIMHDQDCERKLKGIEASLCYVDELTLFENEKVFTALRGTLKRRRYIPAEAQVFMASCNPAGPSHWAFKKWHETPGAQKPFFRFIFLPITENPDPNAVAYVESLKRDNEHDRVAYERDIEGKWVDRPSGDALFAEYFDVNVHVRGNLARNEILHPRPGIPITVGWDLGDGANHALAFMQERSTSDRVVNVVFDEIVHVDSKITYDILVPEIMRRMNYWCEVEDHPFHFIHISDRSAFDRFRAATGSYDHRQVQQLSQHELTKRKETYPYLSRAIRMIECPKPPGSVAARVKLLIGHLARGDIFFSARCVDLIEAVKKLESEEGKPFEPKRSRHLHPYDALTYPLYYSSLGGQVVARNPDAPAPQFMQVGT